MELLERVVELSLEGYCCSQVMALLRQHFPELLVEAVYQEPFVTL